MTRMMRRIAMLLIAALATNAADNSTMHIMEGPSPINSISNGCSNFSCPANEVCILKEVVCVKAPCNSVPSCTPRGPSCITMKCTANTTCVDLPTGSVCQSNDNSTNPCASILCANGTICRVQTVNCLLPPCPPLAQCVSPSTGPSCITMKCTANTTCIDLPTGSVCKPKDSNSTIDPCATMKCGNGTACKVQTVNCLLPPCPPLAQCVSPSTGPSCMTMKCSANTTCVDLPTGSVCQTNANSTNPCASILCGIGSICELQTVNCVRAPCPPIASCVPRTTNSSACLHIKCSDGLECRNGETGEGCYPVSVPHSDLCANHTCPVGRSCSVVAVNCLVARCPPPQPVCGPLNDDPCKLTECNKGFFCVVQRGEAHCLRSSGVSCASTSCAVNTTCIDFKEGTVCIEPRPTSNLTCATVKCGGNTTCVILSNGPTCLPNHGENACNAMECRKGFFCVVQHGEPECVPHSGTSCAATSCPYNTTCIEFRQGATCMEGAIAGGCSNMTCGGRSRCKETLEGPRCISGGKRDDRIVDINGCGRGEEHTLCMPQCEETCRGIHACDPSIPTSSNGSIWTNSTMGNSTSLPSHCVSAGCICRDRFKRNVQGNCVPNNRCWLTPGCHENESWSRCRGCESTCSNQIGGQVCAAVCQSGCACDEGYVRSKRGMCVLPEDCRAVDLINGDHGNQTIAIEG